MRCVAITAVCCQIVIESEVLTAAKKGKVEIYAALAFSQG